MRSMILWDSHKCKYVNMDGVLEATDRKGDAKWETKAARRIRTSVRSRRKANGNERKKIRRIGSRKKPHNSKQDLNA